MVEKEDMKDLEDMLDEDLQQQSEAIVEGVLPKHRKQKSRDSESTAAQVRKFAKKSITLAMKREAFCSGRACTACAKTDQSQDPVSPAHHRLWAYYKIRKNGTVELVVVMYETEGATCWYCYRVWFIRYSDLMTLKEYKEALGGSHELFDAHNKYVQWLVTRLDRWVQEGNDIEDLTPFSWPSPTQLEHSEIYEVIWGEPAEEHMELKDYESLHGNWQLNGRGDVGATGPNGEKLVKLKTSRIWTRQVRHIQQAKRMTSLVDGTDAEAQHFIGDRFRDICKQLQQGKSLNVGLKNTQLTGEKRDEDQSQVAEKASPCKRNHRIRDDQHESVGSSKPLAKAKPKRSPTKPQPAAGSQPRSRGAPAKDKSLLLTTGLQEFWAADESSKKFFGDDWRNVCRNWTLYLKEIAVRIEEEENESVLATLQRLEKSTKVVISVLDAIRKHGLSGDLALEKYKEQVAWCDMKPIVQNPFPVYLRVVMISAAACNAWPPKLFWEQIIDSVWNGLCVGAARETKQLSIICDKVFDLCGDNRNDFAKVKGMLKEFCEAFESLQSGNDVKPISSQTVQMEMLHCCRIAMPESPCKDEDLGESIDYIHSQSSSIGNVLVAKKQGLQILKNVKDVREAKKKEEDLLGDILEYWESAKVLSVDGNHALTEVCSLAKTAKSPAALFKIDEVTSICESTMHRITTLLFSDDSVVKEQNWQHDSVVVVKNRVTLLAGDCYPVACHESLHFWKVVFQQALRMFECLRDVSDLQRSGVTVEDEISPEIASSLFIGLATVNDYAKEFLQQASELCLQPTSGSQTLLAADVQPPTTLEKIQSTFKAFLMGDVGQLCQKKCRASVQPAMDEVVVVCRDMLKGSTDLEGIDSDSELMEKFATFKWKQDLPKAIGLLNSLPNHQTMALEIQFVAHFSALARSYAVVALDLAKNTTRPLRKVSEVRVSELSVMRQKRSDMRNFWSSISSMDTKLFVENVEPGGQVSLGGCFAVGNPNIACETVVKIETSIVEGWKLDMLDLCRLIDSYIVSGWSFVSAKLLQPENLKLLQAILANEKLEKTGKGAALIAQWKRWLQQLEKDGCGSVWDVESVSKWTTVRKEAVAFVEFSAAAKHVVEILPAIKNKPQRVKSAKHFLEELKNKELDVGGDILKRLELLCAGGLPEDGEVKAGDPEVEEGVDDEDAVVIAD